MPVCYRHTDRESHIRCQRCGRPICPDCMHDAAVGFQCPACVAEGRKQTRQGLTRYGGRRPANPQATTMALIAVNVGVWLATALAGGASSPLVRALVLRPDGGCLGVGAPDAGSCRSSGGLWLPGVADGAVWQLLTNAFLHVAVLHLLLNMVAVYVLGPQLEALLGRARFLALYLVSALSASALVMWAAPQFQATLGASGAVFGLFAAYLVVALRVKAPLQPILVILGINLVITVVGRGYISWQGHLGGFVGGILLAIVLVVAPNQRRAQWQWAGVGVVAVLVLALIAARIAVLA